MKMKRIIHIPVLISLCILILTSSCFAGEDRFELTIRVLDNSSAVSGVKFDIYEIGSVSEYGEVTIGERYRSYPVSFSEKETGSWQSEAVTLSGYILNDQRKADYEGTTDAEGTLNVTLSPDSGGRKICLLIGRSVNDGRNLYKIQPSVFIENAEGKAEVFPKVDKETIQPSDLTVHKTWDNITDSVKIPDSVSVNLLRDGTLDQTVELSEKNNWTCSWSGLDGNYEWTCVEQPVSGYETSVTVNDDAVIIKNSKTNPGGKLPQTGGIDYLRFGMLLALGAAVWFLGFFFRKNPF